MSFVCAASVGLFASFAHAGWTATIKHPQDAHLSRGFGGGAGGIVGRVEYPADGRRPHAAYWKNDGSLVDLSLPDSSGSEAYGAAGDQQVGLAAFPAIDRAHAILWRGSASMSTNLHPAFMKNSLAYATDGTSQVGYATANDDGWQAALWTGTSFSWVNLQPQGSNGSIAYGVSGGQQVGVAYVDQVGPQASLWSGTAASWVNLTPPGFTD